MATATLSRERTLQVQAPLPYRFTVEQYHRMIDSEVLTEADRVELLEGWIVEKVKLTPLHATIIDLGQEALRPLLPTAWRVRVQSAITTTDSEPEPDLAIVRGPARRYSRSHPKPHDIALVAEVAEAVHLDNRTQKKRLYARARIPIYWILNLPGSVVEVYENPKAGRSPDYRLVTECRSGEFVPVLIQGRQVGKIAVRDLLP